MGGYILKRVLFMIPTLIGISIIIFLLVRLLPGDIIDVLLGGDQGATEAVKQQAREQLGLTGSYPEQYWRWISGIAQGDFGPTGIAVSASGNVFVVCNGIMDEIPFSGGSYGAPVTLSSSGDAQGIAVGVTGELYVADAAANAVYQLPFNGSSYGAPVSLGSGFNYPQGVAVDASGDVFVADTGNEAVKEIPFTGGGYGAPLTLTSGFSGPLDTPGDAVVGVTVDMTGNVFVADIANDVVKEIPFAGGSYGAPIALGSGFNAPYSVALDQTGRLYVLDRENIWRLDPGG